MNWFRHYQCIVVGICWPLSLLAQPTQVLSGQVLAYRTNRIGDYDGLQLRTTTGVQWVRFPPHTAAWVIKLAPVGQPVIATVSGHPSHKKSPDNPLDNQGTALPTYRLVGLQNGTGTAPFWVSDWPPPPPTRGKLVEAEGPLTGELRDEVGRLAALLTDQYVIELKPHQGESIRTLLEGIRRLGVVGYQRTEPGFINKTGRTLIHPTLLTINGQTFVL